MFLGFIVPWNLYAQTITSISHPNAIKRFRKFEVTAQITGWSGNPDNPNDIEVWASVTKPSGSTIYVPGFYYQGYSINHTTDKIEAAGSPVWKIRYTPTEYGQHTLTIKARSNGGSTVSSSNRTFSATAADANAKGFIRIHPSNEKYFYWDFSGQTHFINGLNIYQRPQLAPAKTSDPWKDEFILRDSVYTPDELYDVYMQLDQLYDTLVTYGGNTMRIRPDSWWLALEVSKSYIDEPGFTVGQYDSRNAFVIDNLVQRAEADQIAFMITEWNTNHNAPAMGSQYTVDSNEDLIKRRLRYVVARWGYSACFFTHEYFNEVNNSWSAPINVNDTFWSGITSWLRSFDYRGTPINSTKDNIDYTDDHYYINGEYPTSNFASNSKSAYSSSVDKPFIWGEYGFQSATFMQNPIGGYVLHEGMWANLVSHRSGALVWHAKEQLLNNPNGDLAFDGIDKFLYGEQLANYNWASASFTKTAGPGGLVTTKGMIGDSKRAFLWFVRTPSNETTERTPSDGNVYQVGSVTDGLYRVEWWDSFKGKVVDTETGLIASSGKVTLTIPNGVTRDIVTKAIYLGPNTTETRLIEAETLSYSGGRLTESDGAASNNSYVYVFGNNSSATLQVNSIPAGDYRVKYYYKTFLNSGVAQLKIDGIVHGNSIDQFTGRFGQFLVADLGVKALSGNHNFQFTVVGKNPNSNGYKVSVDLIVLEKVTSGTMMSSAMVSEAKPEADAFIYPNPAKEWASIEGVDAQDEIGVLTIDGKRIAVPSRFENDLAQVNVASLKPGLYILRIVGPKKFYKLKLMKQ